jgi:hypothetical protein
MSEHRKEYMREFREKNKIQIQNYNREYMPKYYKNNKERMKQSFKKYRLNNREKNRIIWLKSAYGLSLEQYNSMLSSQGDRCAVCGLPKSESKINFSVDHDHKTERVRGILCHYCNTALGLLRDSIETVDNLHKYLLKHSL